jgi:hypothetical protein
MSRRPCGVPGSSCLRENDPARSAGRGGQRSATLTPLALPGVGKIVLSVSFPTCPAVFLQLGFRPGRFPRRHGLPVTGKQLAYLSADDGRGFSGPSTAS